MSIKATFPTGANSITVQGLHQWDYGQILEIESEDLGTEITEVHFARPNMTEAIVRSCSFTNGVGTVTIPDSCLEQSSTVSAWVYRISGTQGYTAKTILLPIIARIRPNTTRDIPTDISDRYTELITEVNEAINALEDGTVTVAHAAEAGSSNYATSAGNAATATYATSAASAEALSTNTTRPTMDANNEVNMTLSSGKTYVISVENATDTDEYETMVLHIGTTRAIYWSTKSANGHYCRYYNDGIFVYNSSGASYRTQSGAIRIREI